MAHTSDGVPPANEFGKMRSYLATQGFSQAWIDTNIGTAPNGRTRSEIADELKIALKTLPKA